MVIGPVVSGPVVIGPVVSGPVVEPVVRGPVVEPGTYKIHFNQISNAMSTTIIEHQLLNMIIGI